MVLAMVRWPLVSAVSLGLTLTLASCGKAPEVTTRALTPFQAAKFSELDELARKFRAEAPSVVNFDFDVDKVDAEARTKLDIQAAWILDHPNVKFRVYGHADKVGSLDYNMDLGLRRAENVVAYLVSKGISERRLEAMISFGEEAPVVATERPERMNRRVLTTVHGFIVPIRGESGGDHVASIDSRLIVDQAPPSSQTVSSDTGTETGPDTGTGTSSSTGSGTSGGGKHANSGRGNGDEGGDPGKSEGKNNGGDEVS